ncbi:MAG TPA: ATP-binding protein [Gammaproteobacteria bacterium]|nr:ATP-binding protein [Gammaproteobacteria bacterium]
MTETTIHDPRELQQAFEAFMGMSAQLESAYRELEQRAERLTLELAAARSERLAQLADKERIADRLGTLLEALPGGVVVLDGTGRVCECNPAALDLLGEPLLGETWEAVTRRVLSDEQQDAHEVRLLDGRRVSISRRTLDSQPGQILLLHDVTETRALQETVSRQQRLSAMGEMTARLAHQIRTPLSSALLYASQLAGGQLKAADQVRFSTKLLQGLRQLERMVHDMLGFARGGAAAAESVPVRELLRDLEQSMVATLLASGARLNIDNQVPTACLQGNREALAGALVNLAANAVQATGQGARLQVTVQETDRGRLEIAVTDNGPGIPAELHERIFEPFFTTRPEGTGLGLAVVQTVLQAHGGGIRLETPAQGGTRFVLELPMTQPELLPGGRLEETPLSHAGKRLSAERRYAV